MVQPAAPGREAAPSAWIARLDGAPAVLQLPADRPRPTVLDAGVERLTVPVTAPLTRAIVDGAGDLGTTWDVLLLSAWQILLWRYTSEVDLVVGCFLGPDPTGVLPLRMQVDPGASFRSTVESTAHHLTEGMTVGPVSVPELLSKVGVTPSTGRHPFFQVAFVRGPVDAGVAPPAPSSEPSSPPFDVLLRLTRDGAMDVSLEYSPALFDQARIGRMAEHLLVALEAGLADPEVVIADLPLLTADDAALLRRWNTTAHPHRRDRGVRDLFAEASARFPESTAVVNGGEQLTYADLDRRAARLASALRERGVGPDVTVAISLERTADLPVAVLGVLQAGGAYVPVDPTYPAARQAYMLESSGARLHLTDRDAAPEDRPNIDVLEVASATGSDVDAPRNVAAVSGSQLGYVIYTSGSTGQPKGVAMPQQALTNLIEWQVRQPGFAQGARTLQFASLSFDVSFQELFTTWCSGGALVLIPEAVRRDPRALLDHIIRHDVQRVFLPFVALRGLADAAVRSGAVPTSLREVYTAGEQLQVDDVLRAFFEALPDCLLENQYGPSESHVVTAQRLNGPPTTWPVLPPIGSPIANTTIHIVDPQGSLVPPGVPGELHIGGVCLARGYLARRDLTEERFIPNPLGGEGPLYRTGDLARWRDDGAVEFLGRADSQMKFRGFRIEPGEIGAVLAGFPGVRQCVAAVVEVEGAGPRLAAYVVPTDGATVSLPDLHRFARESLPDYMVPSHVVVLGAMPLTPSGKVDVKALLAPTFDRRILGGEHVGPRSELERVLVEVWERLLGVGDVGVHDDFFDLGGDSLMAVEMFEVIADRLGRELPLGALAQDPTIARLARRLADGGDAVWASLVPLRSGGSAPPLFCVHGGSGNVASFPLLARALPADQPVYALQWDGHGGTGGARSIDSMARRYVADIRTVQPAGPYHLAGQCVGGLIARRMAQLLMNDGEEVAHLVMYDTPNLSSRSFRYPGGIPAPPASLRPLGNMVLGLAVEAGRFLLGRRPRGRLALIAVRGLLRRRVPPQDQYLQGVMVMVKAVWPHLVRPLDAPTILIHTGEATASTMGLAGSWTDGMRGWSEHVGPRFRSHLVEADHNQLPYEPAAVALVEEALQEGRHPAPTLSSAPAAGP